MSFRNSTDFETISHSIVRNMNGSSNFLLFYVELFYLLTGRGLLF